MDGSSTDICTVPIYTSIDETILAIPTALLSANNLPFPQLNKEDVSIHSAIHDILKRFESTIPIIDPPSRVRVIYHVALRSDEDDYCEVLIAYKLCNTKLYDVSMDAASSPSQVYSTYPICAESVARTANG